MSPTVTHTQGNPSATRLAGKVAGVILGAADQRAAFRVAADLEGLQA